MKRPSYSKRKKNCLAYYRVSSKGSEQSGLSLEAQRDTVLGFIEGYDDHLIAEFTETESRGNNIRPELEKAIKTAIKNDAILIIAKLDRLYRNLSFVSQLMENDVKFVCCDFPRANELTIHIFVAIAQFEKERSSERIREAIANKRERDPKWKPGRPQNLTDEARKKAHDTIRHNARTNLKIQHAYEFIKPHREKGWSYQQIAIELNKEGYRTRQNKKFRPWQVWNIYQRFESENNDK